MGGTTFRCAKCSASYPWAAQFVGKLAKCGCGELLKVPAQPIEGVAPAAAAANPTPAPAPRPVAPAPPPPPTSRVQAAPVGASSGDGSPNIPAFLRMSEADPESEKLDADTEAELAATGKFGEDPDAHRKPNPTRDLHVPLGLLFAGVVLTFIQVYAGSGGGALGSAIAAVATFVKLLVSSTIFLIGGLIAARMGGIVLGTLGPALLKIAAVSIFPAALADTITALLGGDIAVACLGGGVGIVACWGLVSYLFRLDGPKTMTFVTAIAVVKLVLVFVLGGLMALIVIGGSSEMDDATSDLTATDRSAIVDESEDASAELGDD